ncbi:MAG: hypothetical protein R2875_08815 [Desulfobacterales bacterium]
MEAVDIFPEALPFLETQITGNLGRQAGRQWLKNQLVRWKNPSANATANPRARIQVSCCGRGIQPFNDDFSILHPAVQVHCNVHTRKPAARVNLRSDIRVFQGTGSSHLISTGPESSVFKFKIFRMSASSAAIVSFRPMLGLSNIWSSPPERLMRESAVPSSMANGSRRPSAR